MPTLGKKKFAYTKKGKAAYKAAKRKGNKMNETYNRMFNLVIDEEFGYENINRLKARLKARKEAGTFEAGVRNNAQARGEAPTTTSDMLQRARTNAQARRGTPTATTTSTAPSDMLQRARASAAERGEPVAVATPKGGVFKPGNRTLTPKEQEDAAEGQEERRGRRRHLDRAARRQSVTSLAKSAGNIVLPYLKSGGTIKKGV